MFLPSDELSINISQSETTLTPLDPHAHGRLPSERGQQPNCKLSDYVAANVSHLNSQALADFQTVVDSRKRWLTIEDTAMIGVVAVVVFALLMDITRRVGKSCVDLINVSSLHAASAVVPLAA